MKRSKPLLQILCDDPCPLPPPTPEQREARRAVLDRMMETPGVHVPSGRGRVHEDDLVAMLMAEKP